MCDLFRIGICSETRRNVCNKIWRNTALQYGILSNTNLCPRYDTKPSNNEALVLERWGNLEYPFIAIAHIPLLLDVLISSWFPSMGQIELFNYLQCLKPFNREPIKLLVLEIFKDMCANYKLQYL